jgi:beta-lactamase regulating signal transducer with metallopeptidase domain
MDLSFFAEMAWKSALIAGAALMLAYVLRSRAAADRALVLRIGVAMLLLLPPIALALPVLPVEAWAAPETAAAAPLLAFPGPEANLPGLAGAGLQPASPTIWDDPTPLVLLAYLGGLLMVGGRLLAGLMLLRRWTRDARDVTCPEWLAAFDRAGGGERPRLMVSDEVPSPLSWGWLRPVILIDPDTLAEPAEAEAILAHEMAHIARRDWLSLMLTRIATAFFWFNPMVWLLDREIVQQAEEAADCEAAAYVEPARYAQILLSWAQVGGRALPANSIAPKGSALGRRVRAILDRGARERPSGTALTRLAVLLCVAIAAPVAAMKLVEAAAPGEPAPPPAAIAAPQAPGAPAPAAAPRPPAGTPAIRDDVDAVVGATLADLDIDGIVADATADLDPEDIASATDAALREAGPRISAGERARIRREVRDAVARARQARREAGRAVEAARPQIAAAMLAAQRAERTAATALAHGADGMMRGAEGMERGAQNMEREAARLRDPAYREQQIARQRQRGRTVTHQDLIEAADGLEEGAEGMRDGAREMREAAERMRGGDSD